MASPSAVGPKARLGVNLTNGLLQHMPPADLGVYCDSAEPVLFSRRWFTQLAVQQDGSPGVTEGWAHNCDSTLQDAVSSAVWKPQEVVRPDGSERSFTPLLDGSGDPT